MLVAVYKMDKEVTFEGYINWLKEAGRYYERLKDNPIYIEELKHQFEVFKKSGLCL